MHPTLPHKQEHNAYLQLLILFGLLAGGFVLTAVASLLIGLVTFGPAVLKSPELIAQVDQEHLFSLKMQLVVQQILVFLLPALVLAFTQKQRISSFYGVKSMKLELIGLVLLIMICSFPAMSYVVELNQNMHLPSVLSKLEKLMRQWEDAGEETTTAILKTDSLAGLALNLFVIAFIPAVCEEFLFRGALQRIMIRLLKNNHMAIWLTAMIFSTIHFQFFGFFPRLLLGAAFGYIYFWTGSLRYTIFAHFLNNAFAVMVSYYLQINHLPAEKADDMDLNWITYVISAVLTLALFQLLEKKTILRTVISEIPRT